jgi:hypothetical protein
MYVATDARRAEGPLLLLPPLLAAGAAAAGFWCEASVHFANMESGMANGL